MRAGYGLLTGLLAVCAILAAPPPPAHAASCQFTLGFRTLHDLIPRAVGQCVDNPRYSPLTGDGFQDTTGRTGKGGLLVWRKASNVTAFTDGDHTWLLGPFGLQERPNTQRFRWETREPAPAVPSCRSGDPLANVHDPRRLVVVRRCQSVSGTVTSVDIEDDGDVSINLRLVPQLSNLLNAANVAQQQGTLVLEIVPADQPGCVVGVPPRAPFGTADFGVCTGAKVPTPRVGDTITASGPYVLDTNHGWMQIHPVWRIDR